MHPIQLSTSWRRKTYHTSSLFISLMIQEIYYTKFRIQSEQNLTSFTVVRGFFSTSSRKTSIKRSVTDL